MVVRGEAYTMTVMAATTKGAREKRIASEREMGRHLREIKKQNGSWLYITSRSVPQI